MKETFYFPHDYNARNDEKTIYLISKCGYFGYGLYWGIVEDLHQSPNGKLNIKLIDGLAFKYNIDITELNNVITTCLEVGLFIKEDNYISSERVIRNKKDLEDFRLKKSNAGKKGMLKRWGHNNVITKHNKGKEMKGNESKYINNKIISYKDLKKPYNDFLRVRCNDGSIARRYYGEWVDDRDNSVKIDLGVYKELQ